MSPSFHRRSPTGIALEGFEAAAALPAKAELEPELAEVSPSVSSSLARFASADCRARAGLFERHFGALGFEFGQQLALGDVLARVT